MQQRAVSNTGGETLVAEHKPEMQPALRASPHLPSGLPLSSENVYLYTCQEPFLTACSRNADLHHPAFAFVTRDFAVLTWFHLCLTKVVLGGSDSGTFVAFTGQSVEKVNI